MENKKEVVLLREGECLRCGKCCNMGFLIETDIFKDVKKSKNLEKFISENDSKDIFCKHYDIKNKACRLFGKPERPKVCIQHPGSPNSTSKGCGYTFRFIEVTKSELNKLEWDKNVKIFKRKKG